MGLTDKDKPATQRLVILGSARKNSNTARFVRQLLSEVDYNVIDLLDYEIFPYDYSGKYPAGDMFSEIVQQLIKADNIIFATPVYWYAMSGKMKIFFDRFTDIVTIQKEYGRQLKGKKTYLVSVGTEDKMPTGFEVPFKRTSEYLDMEFIDFYYCKTTDLKSYT